MVSVRRALLSVHDKTGLGELARGLTEAGVELVATGGTARFLEEHGFEITQTSELTGFDQWLDGRVKTLHPKVQAAILARRTPEHLKELETLGVDPIDLVVVNLYPFEEVAAKGEAELSEVLENIDIGGVTLIRSAAKNFPDVAVLVSPDQYGGFLERLREGNGGVSEEVSADLAAAAFARTAAYEASISRFLAKDDGFPEYLSLAYVKTADLRYGENPHQKGAAYRDPLSPGGIITAEQLHGKQLSYNNLLDLEGGLALVAEFERPTAAVIKHVNPSGCASADEIAEAYRLAHECDPMSAYGGVVAVNRTLDGATAEAMKKVFLEAVVAPDYEDEALELLKKKKKLRVMRLTASLSDEADWTMHKVRGGLLVQTANAAAVTREQLKVVTKRAPTDEEIHGMLFAVKVLRHVKSNSIVLVKGERTVGIGAGQMSRVDASMLAGHKAKEEAVGSVLASDAFFPFRDGVDEAAKVGVAAVIQPGGSIRDQEVIDAADEHGMAMVFSGVRMFTH
jgi:phosphoribosylaminoimidazolecarboxamide formyltransferase/IMP cyclohydrolase